MPSPTVPGPRQDIYEYIDAVVLLAALGISSYLILKKRSRRAIFVLMVFSLIYFGFWREGCVCPIGAIQNIILSFFDAGYAVPITVAAFFLLPLLFTLFFGRTFCAAVCPLGAVQDFVQQCAPSAQFRIWYCCGLSRCRIGQKAVCGCLHMFT
jgi:polyferredoxin